MHLLDHENPDTAYEMLCVARSHLGEAGGARIGVTLVPVVFSALRLANKISGTEVVANGPEKDSVVSTETAAEPRVDVQGDEETVKDSCDAEKETLDDQETVENSQKNDHNNVSDSSVGRGSPVMTAKEQEGEDEASPSSEGKRYRLR